jgi:hypothetical protein
MHSNLELLRGQDSENWPRGDPRATGHASETVGKVLRVTDTDWTGGQQPGFSSLSYVLKQFYRKKSATPVGVGGPEHEKRKSGGVRFCFPVFV